MFNPDLLSAAKILLENMKALRGEMDALNIAFMTAMDQPDSAGAVRALFPNIISTSKKSAEIISDAFLAVNWEVEGNTPQTFYDLLAGKCEGLPEDLQQEVTELLSSLDGTEKEMFDRFGPEPMMAAITSLGLEEELSAEMNTQDEIQALMAALQDTKDVPLVTQE